MYLPAGGRIVALDPETGKEIWSYEPKESVPSRRGVRLTGLATKTARRESSLPPGKR